MPRGHDNRFIRFSPIQLGDGFIDHIVYTLTAWPPYTHIHSVLIHNPFHKREELFIGKYRRINSKKQHTVMCYWIQDPGATVLAEERPGAESVFPNSFAAHGLEL